jgi:5-methylcytosine-specific restriction endonuclease McrBC regulatory subunit McrC
VSIPGLQLLVKPKIPQEHLLYLAQCSDVLPAMDSHRAVIEQDQHLVSLIAHWFIAALEKLLEEGISRDYRMSRDRLETVRGRIDLLRTARMFYKGQLSVFSEFEEFDFDTPLNRILLVAALVVASGEPLPSELRRRALRATRLLDGVGRFRASDMVAEVDRPTAHYADSVALAKEIIHSSGRALGTGESPGWTFLFRTADPVESGLRVILKEALQDQCKVAKRSFPLTGSSKTVNPDLVFGDVRAVGDVKYKVRDGDWQRPDLYEVVAFAEAASVVEALLVDFQAPSSRPPQAVSLGRIRVQGLSWPVHETINPEQAARSLSAKAREWAATLPKAIRVGAAGFEPATSGV